MKNLRNEIIKILVEGFLKILDFLKVSKFLIFLVLKF